jgi:hypothetical protein
MVQKIIGGQDGRIKICRKHISCNSEERSKKKLNLFPIKGRNIELSFSGDRISSDGGLLLLRELDSQLNLLSSASNCIHDERDPRYI